MAIWSEGKYVSRDLDFIEEGAVPRRQVKAALARIGFVEKNRYFVHPETDCFVEFPTGPLTVGDEKVESVAMRDTGAGRLRLLSPTDCVKDRLAAFFHWNDREGFGTGSPRRSRPADRYAGHPALVKGPSRRRFRNDESSAGRAHQTQPSTSFEFATLPPSNC